jgi:hypothetical protein
MKEAAIVEASSNFITYVTIFLILIVCLPIAIGIGMLDFATGTSNVTQVSTSAADLPAGDVINTKYLEITNHSFSEDLLFTIVNGTIVNNSNNTINSAEVSVQFYDENGTLITSSTENAKFVILASGENSSFNVRSDLGDEIPNSYKVIPGGDIQVGWIRMNYALVMSLTAWFKTEKKLCQSRVWDKDDDITGQTLKPETW